MTIFTMTNAEQIKVEKARISVLIRKLARKLSTLEPCTEKYYEVYANYTFLQDYRSELVAELQQAIYEDRYGI